MNDKFPAAVYRYLSSCSNIFKNFPPDGQKHTSRYYDIDFHHAHILNKLTTLNNKNEKFTLADGQNMKQMLVDSLELADRKIEISEHLMCMVNDNMFRLNMNKRDIEMTQMFQSEYIKKPKRMLKWVPNYEETDSDSVEDLLKTGDSTKHLNSSNTKITETNKNIQIKTDCDFQTSETIITDTDKNIKTTVNKNSRTKLSKSKIISSESSESDSEVQPTYCICEKISYGNMICCDNDLCPIEWFHFGCVSLSRKPKGKWYCPRCRGKSSRIMKPRKIFFKELEEYNKRKEEDW